MAYDAVIAGGGIGGTVLAHLLARGGKRVVVIEKSTAPPNFVRPEGLWPATAKLLRDLLAKSENPASSWVPLQGLRVLERDRPLLELDRGVFDRAGVDLAMTDPNQTRERLLQLPTFELRRGVEVIGVLKDGARISGVRTRDAASKAEQDVTAAWTFGDDGVNSRVREACGIPLKTRLFPIDFMPFGFVRPEDFPGARLQVWLNPRRSRSGIFGLAAFPLPGGRGATLVVVRPQRFDANPRQQEDWAEFTAGHPLLSAFTRGIKFPAGLPRIQRPYGHAARYGADGAALLGDAVHPVSPAAGQGANMAVADALVLADVLLSGRPNPIAEYERRRRPANERSLNFTRRGAQALNLPQFLFDPLFPILLRYVNARPHLFEGLLRNAAAAFQEDRIS